MSAFTFPEAALAAHTAVLGKTGSGKTSTAKLAVEQVVAAGARVCILDPIKSDWWGITSSADGRRAGLPFQILGGPHGHVPLTSSAGAAVAELVAAGDLPLSVIDMALFEPGGLQAFFNGLAPVLLQRMRGVLHLVMEEAHLFAPKERSGIGAETHAIHWAKALATAGRSKGIRLILATQRTQSLHNALLGSCETMITHRLTAPADQTPVKAWLKANVDRQVFAEVESSLAGLPTGTGWLCSGEAGIFEKVAFPRIATFDNTATPTGELADRKVKMAPIDVGKLRTLIGEKLAEAEANDPAKLKARIAELEAARKGEAAPALRQSEPGAAAAQIANAEEIAAADQRGYERGAEAAAPIWYRRGFDGAVGHFRSFGERLRNAEAVEESFQVWRTLGALEGAAGLADTHDLIRNWPPAEAGNGTEVSTKPTANYAEKYADTTTAEKTSRVAEPSGAAPAVGATLPPAKCKILNALAWLETIGQRQPPRNLVAFIGGISSKSSAYENNISALRTAGLLDYPQSGRLALTDSGRVVAVAPARAPTHEVLMEALAGKLQPALMRIVRSAVGKYPSPLSRATLADGAAVSVRSSAFENNVSRLSSLGLITYPHPGMVRAADLLFPEQGSVR